MKKKRSTFLELLIAPFEEWSKDKASQLAAALAFYTVMSLVPLLVIIVVIASFFIKSTTALDQLTSQIARFSSPQMADFVKTLITNVPNPITGSIASILSILVLIFGASGIFSQLQSSLNQIWNVPPKKDKSAIRKALVGHLRSFLMVLAIGLLFLVLLIINATLALLVTNVVGSQNAVPAQIINYLITFVMVTVLIALIFKVVPDREIPWGDVWLGAAFTSLLFLVGRWAIGLYLSVSKTASGYGAAGSLVVLLLWIYYSAQIFFFGAEFTQVYARTVGSHKDKDTNEVSDAEKNDVEKNKEEDRQESVSDMGQNQPAS